MTFHSDFVRAQVYFRGKLRGDSHVQPRRVEHLPGTTESLDVSHVTSTTSFAHVTSTSTAEWSIYRVLMTTIVCDVSWRNAAISSRNSALLGGVTCSCPAEHRAAITCSGRAEYEEY
eukprot:530164-Rhodomonas_salina.2